MSYLFDDHSKQEWSNYILARQMAQEQEWRARSWRRWKIRIMVAAILGLTGYLIYRWHWTAIFIAYFVLAFLTWAIVAGGSRKDGE